MCRRPHAGNQNTGHAARAETGNPPLGAAEVEHVLRAALQMPRPAGERARKAAANAGAARAQVGARAAALQVGCRPAAALACLPACRAIRKAHNRSISVFLPHMPAAGSTRRRHPACPQAWPICCRATCAVWAAFTRRRPMSPPRHARRCLSSSALSVLVRCASASPPYACKRSFSGWGPAGHAGWRPSAGAARPLRHARQVDHLSYPGPPCAR